MSRSFIRLAQRSTDKGCLCKPVPRGTVSRLSHHAIIGSAVRYQDWEPKNADSNANLLSSLLKPQSQAKVNVVHCEGSSLISSGDLLLLPSGMIIKQASASTIQSVSTALNEHDLNTLTSELSNIDTQSWSKIHSLFLVCAHTQRDFRCGQYGPPVIEALRKEIQKAGLSDRMLVYPISHVGRHDLAANVIVHSKHSSDWLGLIEPADAEQVVAATLAGSLKQSLADNWRGEMFRQTPQ